MPEEPLPPLRPPSTSRRPESAAGICVDAPHRWSRAEASPRPRSSWSLCRALSRAGAQSRRATLLAASLPLRPRPPSLRSFSPSPGPHGHRARQRLPGAPSQGIAGTPRHPGFSVALPRAHLSVAPNRTGRLRGTGHSPTQARVAHGQGPVEEEPN